MAERTRWHHFALRLSPCCGPAHLAAGHQLAEGPSRRLTRQQGRREGADRAGVERVPAAPARPARSRVARRSEFSCSKPPTQRAGQPQRCGAGQRLAAGGRRTRTWGHVRAPLRTNDLSAVTPTRTWPADGRGTEASVLPGGPRHCSVHTEEQGRGLRACGPRAQTRAGGSQRKRANRSEHGSPPISRFCSRSPPDQPVLLTVLPLSSAQRLCADANPLT